MNRLPCPGRLPTACGPCCPGDLPTSLGIISMWDEAHTYPGRGTRHLRLDCRRSRNDRCGKFPRFWRQDKELPSLPGRHGNPRGSLYEFLIRRFQLVGGAESPTADAGNPRLWRLDHVKMLITAQNRPVISAWCRPHRRRRRHVRGMTDCRRARRSGPESQERHRAEPSPDRTESESVRRRESHGSTPWSSSRGDVLTLSRPQLRCLAVATVTGCDVHGVLPRSLPGCETHLPGVRPTCRTPAGRHLRGASNS